MVKRLKGSEEFPRLYDSWNSLFLFFLFFFCEMIKNCEVPPMRVSVPLTESHSAISEDH